MPENPNLELTLRPSRIWTGVLVSATLAVAVITLLLPLAVIFQVLILFTAGLLFVSAKGYQSKVNRFDRLSQRTEAWRFWHSNTEVCGEVLSVDYVSSWLIVLIVKTSDKKTLRIPVFRDAVDVGGFRQLQLYARNGGF